LNLEEYRFKKADGRYALVSDKGFLVFGKEGRLIRMVGSMQDITEKREMEKRLLKQELNKQKIIAQAMVDAQEKERAEIGKELHDNINQILSTTKLYLELAKNDNKEVVVGIRKRDGDLRFFHAQDAKSGTLAKYVRENISEDVEVIFTDDHVANVVAMRKAGRSNHKTINHSKGSYVIGDIHTNTIENAFSLFKRGIMGTWHHISAKHLAAYLEEMEFRFNRRKDHDLFLDTLRHMVTAPVLTFEKLTA